MSYLAELCCRVGIDPGRLDRVKQLENEIDAAAAELADALDESVELSPNEFAAVMAEIGRDAGVELRPYSHTYFMDPDGD